MKPFVPVSLIIFFLFIAVVSGAPKLAKHINDVEQTETAIASTSDCEDYIAIY